MKAAKAERFAAAGKPAPRRLPTRVVTYGAFAGIMCLDGCERSERTARAPAPRSIPQDPGSKIGECVVLGTTFRELEWKIPILHGKLVPKTQAHRGYPSITSQRGLSAL